MKNLDMSARMKVFHDSNEIAAGINGCRSAVRANKRHPFALSDSMYWLGESEVHIEGLWNLCLDLYRENERLKSKVIASNHPKKRA